MLGCYTDKRIEFDCGDESGDGGRGGGVYCPSADPADALFGRLLRLGRQCRFPHSSVLTKGYIGTKESML